MGLLDDFGGSVGGAQGADPLKVILMKKTHVQPIKAVLSWVKVDDCLIVI